MSAPIWTKIIFKSLTAFGGAIGVLAYKINNDSCLAEHGPPKASGIPWDSNWDGQQLKAKRNLLLIRHGQYDMNDRNHALTSLGKEQARLTGIRLKQLRLPYTKLVHSPMLRAVQTAEIIQNNLCEPLPSSTNNEIAEGVPYPPDPIVSSWMPSQESLREDPDRIECGFRQTVYRAHPSETHDTYEIIVCHANVIRFFVCRALQFSPAAWLRFALHNCSITWLVLHPDGRVELRTCGDSGHFTRGLMTS